MLAYLFEQLYRRGYRQTSLSVQKANPALRLYRRMGYRVVKENDHDVVMVRQLGIYLRSWEKGDAPELVMAINNNRVLDNLRDGIPYPYTEKDAAEFISATLNAEEELQYVYAITYDGKVIGSIGIFRRDNIHRLTAELGYYLAEPYWNKGIMTEAIRQIAAFAFSNTDIVRIFAQPFAENQASCRVLEKVGFELEGVMRHNAIKNGQLADMKLYALIKRTGIKPANLTQL